MVIIAAVFIFRGSNTNEDTPVDNISKEQKEVKTLEIESEPVEKEPEMLEDYKEYYESNNEFYGWLKIDDTIIDYPVMHTPDESNKYLYLDFDGNDYIPGTLFLDYRATTECDNIIIHGHHMKDQTMFGSLLRYNDKAFRDEHSIIHFDNLYEKNDYEVVYAFYDRIYDEDDPHFKYYDFVDVKDEEEYNNAISYFESISIYDTGITPEYGDQLITLSTCAYHVEDGRFAVVARKIED